ncbi:hypothetical protein Agub_g6144 [Astrephomene gubernaculifera]|uniref:Uncharacterized protein n=1 Tax=Astrephomene gubernaculifera TaxID=47775 RepID=A0AAD3HL73_9CHLO|nr:hypothetical protein Agub_g6144 [Astrephomene gubernaculifera]
MKPHAIVAVIGSLWLLHRRWQHSSSKAKQEQPSQPTALQHATSVIAHSGTNANLAQPPPPIPAAALTSGTISVQAVKPMLGAVLQWIFLILLGAAMSLTAVKGAWDVFAVLVAAAGVQLGGQLARGMSGSSRRSSSSPRVARGSSSASSQPRSAAASQEPSTAALSWPPVPPPSPDPRLQGVWVKDPSRSEPMDEAIAAMRLNGLVRSAVRLIRGLELDVRGGRFNMAIFSVIAWFKVRESYGLDGGVGQYNRRDLRRGKHSGSVAVQPDGSLLLSLTWGEPLPGSGTDHFAVVSAASSAAAAAGGAAAASGGGGGGGGGGEEWASGAARVVPPPSLPAAAAAAEGDLLVVTSTLQLLAGPASGRTITYRTVYVRVGGRGGGGGRQQQQNNNSQLQSQQATLTPPQQQQQGLIQRPQTPEQLPQPQQLMLLSQAQQDTRQQQNELGAGTGEDGSG